MGTNLNVPVARGTGDDAWLAAVGQLADAVRGHDSDALVVGLGVDAAAADPESPLRATTRGYREAGRLLAAVGLPTVLVQEGGCDLATIGELVVATLTGFAEA